MLVTVLVSVIHQQEELIVTFFKSQSRVTLPQVFPDPGVLFCSPSTEVPKGSWAQ